jgi:hypothetical protein
VPNGSHAVASLCGGALTFGSLAIVRAPSAFCVPERDPARDLASRECPPERWRTRVAQVPKKTCSPASTTKRTATTQT